MAQQERRYWNEEFETLPLDKLKKLQEERLQSMVARAYEKTNFYRKKFDQMGVKPKDVKTIDDIQKLPMIESEDFRKVPVSEKLAVPMEEVRYVGSTSGTTGIPEPILYTKYDWEEILISEMEPRCRWTAGVRPNDVIHVLTGYRCCERAYDAIGARVIRADAGRGMLDQQIRVDEMMGVTVLEHLPTLVLKYFERAKELGIDIKKGKLRMVIGAGEAWAETFKKKIELEYGKPFMNVYGTAEFGGVCSECEERKGMHIFSDLCIVEIIDPETGKVLNPGEEGEAVITSLVNEAVPFIRYKTGDIMSLLPYEPCPCGRTFPKLSVCKGRATQFIKVRGKRILPIDVEEIIADIPGLTSEYQIILERPGELDRLKVKAEHRPDNKNLGALREKLENAINKDLGIQTEVELVPPGALPRPLFKAQRVITTYDKTQ